MTQNDSEIIDSTIDTEITDNQDEIEIDLTDDTQEDIEELKKKLLSLFLVES